MQTENKMSITLSVKIDPLERYASHSNEEIIMSCGHIPHWIFDDYLKAANETPEGAFKKVIEDNYQFVGPDLSGTVSHDGLYQHRSDPDLYPLICFDGEVETMYQYPYGIIAVISKDSGEVVYNKRID